jgi:hypothetical protein
MEFILMAETSRLWPGSIRELFFLIVDFGNGAPSDNVMSIYDRWLFSSKRKKGRNRFAFISNWSPSIESMATCELHVLEFNSEKLFLPEWYVEKFDNSNSCTE